MLQYIDQAIAPLAYGRLTPAGSAFELWDLFVRFRSWVWTGETKRWKVAGEKLCELLALREQGDPTAEEASTSGSLQANGSSLLPAGEPPLADRLSKLAASGAKDLYRFCRVDNQPHRGSPHVQGQQMRWSRLGAHCLVQVRAALLNQELDEIAHCQFPWLGEQRISWPWQQTSHPF